MAVIKNMMVRAGADFSAFTTQAKKASSSMKGMQNNITRSCSAMKRAVSGVSKVLGALGAVVTVTAIAAAARDAAEAYDEAAEGEIKLATVMRNTMGARNEEIQSILDLCSAQQKLGVIEADAQIAGAQELATYLGLSSSLKTLIPVMNDMAAQQYGWNATAEQCTQIATMLGKVMEGQTGALSRYGYYFTEAEEAILKTGTEEERCAVLANIVTQSVGGMNHALAQTPSGRMRQLSNALGDIKEKFGECVRTIGVLLLPLLWKVAEILELITSWANRALNSIAKVFGYASLLTGWKDIGTGIGTGIGDLGEDFGDLGSYIGGAGEAAEEAKRKMLGFDELNVLGGNGTNGGGSGGGGGSGWGGSGGAGGGTGSTGGLLGALQELTGGEGDTEGIGWLENLLYKVKDHLGLIKDQALAIGAAFLGWKVLKQFLPKIGQKGFAGALTKVLSIVTAVYGAALEVASGFRAWNEGLDFDNLSGMLQGAANLTLGLGTAFGKVGVEIGLLVSSFGLLGVACHEWITTGQLTNETAKALEIGILGVGGAISLMIGNWIPLLIAVVAGLAVAIAARANEIQAKLQELDAWLQGKFTQDWRNTFGPVLGTILNSFCVKLQSVWNVVRDNLQGWISFIHGTFTGNWREAWNGIKNIFSSAINALPGIARSAMNAIISAVQSAISWINSLISSIRGAGSSIHRSSFGIFHGGGGGFFAKGGVLRSGWGVVGEEGPEIIQMKNGSAVITPMNIPRLAQGAVLPANKPFMAMVGEQRHGTNVEAPLETIQEAVAQVMDDQMATILAGFEAAVLHEMGDISGALEASIHPEILAEGGLAGQYGTNGAAAADLSGGEDSLDGLLQAVMNVYQWLQTEGSRPYVGTIDGDVLFEAMVERNNRAIRRTGASPIRV